MADTSPYDLLERGLTAVEGMRVRLDTLSADVGTTQTSIQSLALAIDRLSTLVNDMQREIKRREDREDITFRVSTETRQNLRTGLLSMPKAFWDDPTGRAIIFTAILAALGLSTNLINIGAP